MGPQKRARIFLGRTDSMLSLDACLSHRSQKFKKLSFSNVNHSSLHLALMSHTVMETCANPGCSEPGKNKCAGCKTTPYCGPVCQKDHWPTHKESCDGRLRKMGMDHLKKAEGFFREDWPQTLRHSDLAATKLKQLKDRPIEEISFALSCKCTALGFLGRYREKLECAKEWYCLWDTKPTDVGAIHAAFALIDSCMKNKEYTDARLYASTLWGIINHKHDNKIPDDLRQHYIARGAYFLGQATLELAKAGGIPLKEKQKAGQEAIALLRKALEIHTELHETEDNRVANDMVILAKAIDYFHDDRDDESLRLFEKSKAIHTRVYGSLSVNVAVIEERLSTAYYNRSINAQRDNDLEREQAALERSLPHLCEADRIFRALGRIGSADDAARNIVNVEERLRQLAIAKIAVAATKG